MRKVTFADKEDSVGLNAVDDKHKIIARDMNDIKKAINENAEELKSVCEKVTEQLTEALNFASNTFNNFGTSVAVGALDDVPGALNVKGTDGDTTIHLIPHDSTDDTEGVEWICNGDGESTITGILNGTFKYVDPVSIKLTGAVNGTAKFNGVDDVVIDTSHTTSNVTCSAAGWAGTSAPFTNTIAVAGVTATNVVEVGLNSAANDNQVKACMKASIAKITQSANAITLYAYGSKPAVDIPLSIIIM